MGGPNSAVITPTPSNSTDKSCCEGSGKLPAGKGIAVRDTLENVPRYTASNHDCRAQKCCASVHPPSDVAIFFDLCFIHLCSVSRKDFPGFGGSGTNRAPCASTAAWMTWKCPDGYSACRERCLSVGIGKYRLFHLTGPQISRNGSSRLSAPQLVREHRGIAARSNGFRRQNPDAWWSLWSSP